MRDIIHKPNNKRKLEAYIRILEKRGKLIRFGRYIFDAEALFETRYECDPARCLREASGRHFGSCCTDYSVDLEPYEKKRLEQIVRKGRKICAKKYPWILNERLFKKDKSGWYINHRKNNTCAFSVIENGRILCVVDLLAKELKLERKHYKPTTCYSWPFDCLRTEDKKIFVSVINKKNGKHLVQVTGALKCVSGSAGKPAAESLKEQLKSYLGKGIYRALMKKRSSSF